MRAFVWVGNLKGRSMAKREKVTDADRAIERAWDYNRLYHRTKPWWNLTRKQRDFIRGVLWQEAQLIGFGIEIGRALATEGGKPGKAKKGGGR